MGLLLPRIAKLWMRLGRHPHRFFPSSLFPPHPPPAHLPTHFLFFSLTSLSLSPPIFFPLTSRFGSFFFPFLLSLPSLPTNSHTHTKVASLSHSLATLSLFFFSFFPCSHHSTAFVHAAPSLFFFFSLPLFPSPLFFLRSSYLPTYLHLSLSSSPSIFLPIVTFSLQHHPLLSVSFHFFPLGPLGLD